MLIIILGRKGIQGLGRHVPAGPKGEPGPSGPPGFKGGPGRHGPDGECFVSFSRDLAYPGVSRK